VNDPTTWATFDEIWAGVKQGRFHGCGIMLLGRKSAYIDCDGVRDPTTGVVLPWVWELIALVPGVYVEITPSGCGVRIVGDYDGSPSIHTRQAHPGGGYFEIFVNVDTGRYVTVSGHQLPGRTCSDQPCDIGPIVNRLTLGGTGTKPHNKGNGQQPPTDGGKLIELLDIDAEIAELIMNGTKNGQSMEVEYRRSTEFHNVVRYLRREGYSFADVVVTLENYPNGVQAKYDGRLEQEVWRSWGKLDSEFSGEEFKAEGEDGDSYDGNGHSGTGQATPDPDEVTLAELEHQVIAPLTWIVPDYIPEGLTVFAGRPKIGKSWLMLGVALGVARGTEALGKPVIKGTVLYCGLEDGKRRMQDRVRKILGHAIKGWPPNFYFRRRLEPLDQGGLAMLEQWLKKHPDHRLVVIDTLGRVRGMKRKNEAPYQYDYRLLAALHQLAEQYRIAIVVVHHVRKADADDVLDTISGTTGIAGACEHCYRPGPHQARHPVCRSRA
jgi:hypothetical protein